MKAKIRGFCPFIDARNITDGVKDETLRWKVEIPHKAVGGKGMHRGGVEHPGRKQLP